MLRFQFFLLTGHQVCLMLILYLLLKVQSPNFCESNGFHIRKNKEEAYSNFRSHVKLCEIYVTCLLFSASPNMK
jgi:hypothetical protein